jgi:xanthine/uracil/vitamin C permease (AzgA family)
MFRECGEFSRGTKKGNKPMLRTFYSSVTCAVLVSSLAAVSAQAAGGCGPGFHRGLLGVCVANGPAVVVVAPPVVAVAPVVVAAPAPAVVVAPAAPAVVIAPAVVCGRGFRWHPGFRRCVVL